MSKPDPPQCPNCDCALVPTVVASVEHQGRLVSRTWLCDCCARTWTVTERRAKLAEG